MFTPGAPTGDDRRVPPRARRRLALARMKIAVCVKAVPDAAAGARIDPATKRLDRSGELALSEFDTHAIEEALRLQRGAGRGRGRRRLDGPGEGDGRAAQGARDGRRPRGARLRRRARRRGPARDGRRRSPPRSSARAPDLVLFGQQSADGDGACLWAAVAERLRRAGRLAGRGADGRRRHGDRRSGRPSSATRRIARAAAGGRRRVGRDQRAALPVAQGDHGREVEAAGDARRAADVGGAGASATTVLALGAAAAARREPPRSRATATPPRRSSSSSPRSGCCEDARLPRAPRRRRDEGLARRAREGARARRRGRRRRRRLGRAARSPRQALGARPCTSPTTRGSTAPLPQPRVDVLAELVRDEGFDTVLFAQSVLAADVAAGLAARLGAGPELGSRRPRRARRRARRQAAGARRLGRASTSGWVDAGALARLPRRHVRRRRAGGRAPRCATSTVELEEHSLLAELVEHAHEEAARARRSRTPT